MMLYRTTNQYNGRAAALCLGIYFSASACSLIVNTSVPDDGTGGRAKGSGGGASGANSHGAREGGDGGEVAAEAGASGAGGWDAALGGAASLSGGAPVGGTSQSGGARNGGGGGGASSASGGRAATMGGTPGAGGKNVAGGSATSGGTLGAGGIAVTTGGEAGRDEGSVGTLGKACLRAGATACEGQAQKLKLSCAGGNWASNGSCDAANNCDTTPGPNAGSCQPIVAACNGKQPGARLSLCSEDGKSVLACGPDLVTTTVAETCAGETPACSNGTCVACTPKATRCSRNLLQTCSASGTWDQAQPCPSTTPVCSANACIAPPSCAALPSNCGAAGTDSCCSSPIVDGGIYFRSNDSQAPATVSSFRLDAYEITVGRFKKFVSAYSQKMIAAGAGKNPNNSNDVGWDTAFNASLPKDADELTSIIQCGAQTWSLGDDRLPMTCINWFVAEAFCIWDGGRLPTEAEWNYAAAGGNEQRMYPWGTTDPATKKLAVYASCCSTANIARVGSIPAGNGRWGQADLAGNLWEWTQDWWGNYGPECIDCAVLTPSGERVLRGGSFGGGEGVLRSSFRDQDVPSTRTEYGARCARVR